MAQPSDRTVHFPLFTGTDNAFGGVEYRLFYPCHEEPGPRDCISTDADKVTCEGCLKWWGTHNTAGIVRTDYRPESEY